VREEEKGAFARDLNLDVLTRAISWRTVIGFWEPQPGKADQLTQARGRCGQPSWTRSRRAAPRLCAAELSCI